LATAHIVHNLEMAFTDGFDPQKFLDGTDGIKTTIFRYPLTVTVERRKREQS
jgi:hypothetical protein